MLGKDPRNTDYRRSSSLCQRTDR